MASIAELSMMHDQRAGVSPLPDDTDARYSISQGLTFTFYFILFELV